METRAAGEGVLEEGFQGFAGGQKYSKRKISFRLGKNTKNINAGSLCRAAAPVPASPSPPTPFLSSEAVQL